MSKQPVVRVRDVMKTSFDLIDGLTTVSDALCNAKHLQTNCFIIDKRHEDDEYGVVFFSDIAKLVLAKDRAPDRVNIYEIMSKPVISVRPDMDIRYCSRLFDNFGIARAPVIDRQTIVGVVSYTDIVVHGLVNQCSLGETAETDSK